MIIGLHQPKFADNLANVVRSLSCFGGGTVITTGTRIQKALSVPRTPRALRHKDYRDVEVIMLDGDFAFSGTPVAVEFLEGECLTSFDHPDDAFYIFGPEDGSLPPYLLKQCHRFVKIPTKHCLNLSHAVTCVLYDRTVKCV